MEISEVYLTLLVGTPADGEGVAGVVIIMREKVGCVKTLSLVIN